MNSIPPLSQNWEDIKYIKFEILQIVSPSEDVKFSNVRGLYLRKYGSSLFEAQHKICNYEPTRNQKANAGPANETREIALLLL